MHGWIGDVAAALVAVTDLAVAFKYAAHLNKQEKEIWPT
jgi:hypothetical protein